MRGRLTTPTHIPNLSVQSLRNSNTRAASAPDSHAAFLRQRFHYACRKDPRFMSGVGEYKTRKGNMSGPSLVGFLAPDAYSPALRKHPEVLMIDQRYRYIFRPYFLSEVADA